MHAQIRAKMKYKLTLSTFAGYAIFAEKKQKEQRFSSVQLFLNHKLDSILG